MYPPLLKLGFHKVKNIHINYLTRLDFRVKGYMVNSPRKNSSNHIIYIATRRLANRAIQTLKNSQLENHGRFSFLTPSIL